VIDIDVDVQTVIVIKVVDISEEYLKNHEESLKNHEELKKK